MAVFQQFIFNLPAEAEIAFAHLCKVNEWTKTKAQKYIEEQFQLYRRRSRIKWNLDLSFLAKHFAIAVTPESALQRSERASLFRIKDYWEAQTLESLLED